MSSASSKRRPDVLLSELAYNAVRDAIHSSKLKPGDRVSEYRIAEQLNISRTPAREGLLKLESEGLLTTHAGRGLIVAPVEDDAVHELYDARMLLEGCVSAMAARKASRPEIETLLHLVEAEAKYADDPEKMYGHNRLFHDLISRASRNRYLAKFLTSIRETLATEIGFMTLDDPARRHEVLLEHRALANAIAMGDEEAAREIAVRHCEGALRTRIAQSQTMLPSSPVGALAPRPGRDLVL